MLSGVVKNGLESLIKDVSVSSWTIVELIPPLSDHAASNFLLAAAVCHCVVIQAGRSVLLPNVNLVSQFMRIKKKSRFGITGLFMVAHILL